MKRIFMLSSLILSTNLAQSSFELKIDGSENISINSKDKNIKSQQNNSGDKFKSLENAIVKLKRRVASLEQRLNKQNNTSKQRKSPLIKRMWGCYLQDNFGNTYSGQGPTKSHASAAALKQCSGLSCKEKNLRCSEN